MWEILQLLLLFKHVLIKVTLSCQRHCRGTEISVIQLLYSDAIIIVILVAMGAQVTKHDTVFDFDNFHAFDFSVYSSRFYCFLGFAARPLGALCAVWLDLYTYCS